MSGQDRAIAAILVLHAASGVALSVLGTMAGEREAARLLPDLLLAGMGIAAAVGWGRQRRWALVLALAFYFVQLVHVLNPAIQWSWLLGFNLTVASRGADGSEIGLNLFALGMLGWISVRAFVRRRHAVM